MVEHEHYGPEMRLARIDSVGRFDGEILVARGGVTQTAIRRAALKLAMLTRSSHISFEHNQRISLATLSDAAIELSEDGLNRYIDDLYKERDTVIEGLVYSAGQLGDPDQHLTDDEREEYESDRDMFIDGLVGVQSRIKAEMDFGSRMYGDRFRSAPGE